MFKGTNKFWKGLALLLVLCMLPTVALADVTEYEAVIEYDAADQVNADGNVKLTVTGQAGKDITILALRGASALGTLDEAVDGASLTSNIPAEAEDLKKAVTYIDQETAGDDGKVKFEFIPRDTELKGGVINIFIGGEDVKKVMVLSVARQLSAPELAPQAWYAGEDLVFDISKCYQASGDFNSAADWAKLATATFTVEGEDPVSVPLFTGADETLAVNSEIVDVTNKTLTFDQFNGKKINKVEIATADNVHRVTVYDEKALEQAPKTAGTVTVVNAATPVIVGENATATVAVAPENKWGSAWLEAVKAGSATIKVGSETATFEGNSGVEIFFTCETEVTGIVTIAVANYEVAESKEEVTFTTAAKADKAELEKGKTAYYKTDGEDADIFYTADPEYIAAQGDDKTDKDMFGRKFVTLEKTAVNGSTLAWSVSIDGADAIPVEFGDAETEKEYELVRPASNNPDNKKKTVYKFTATVTYGEETLTATLPEITVTKVGSALSIEEANVAILKADAYGMTGKTLISVVGPEDFSGSMSIGGVKLFYAPDKAKYYGVVDSTLAANAAAVVSNVEFDEATPSENLYFGVAVAEEGKTALNGRDFLLSVRLTKDKLNDTDVVTDKTYIALDVATSEPDGQFIGGDFLAMVRGTKGTQLPVLTVAE